MTRILVTGSSGHLGEALVRTLREQGRDVVGLDILPSPFTDIVGSVADPNAVSRAMHDVTAEVRSLGDVDVVERPPSPLVEVATFRGSPHRHAWSFGELLDRALDLAGPQDP